MSRYRAPRSTGNTSGSMLYAPWLSALPHTGDGAHDPGIPDRDPSPARPVVVRSILDLACPGRSCHYEKPIL